MAVGESCALTTACLMGYDECRAEGITETRVRAVAINRMLFDEMISSSRACRNLVFKAFSQRITNLLRVIEDIAFQHLELRLAHLLVKLVGDCNEVAATHQALANELGGAREVVSRQLSEFQKCGWLKVSRGVISITSRMAIEGLAGARHYPRLRLAENVTKLQTACVVGFKVPDRGSVNPTPLGGLGQRHFAA